MNVKKSVLLISVAAVFFGCAPSTPVSPNEKSAIKKPVKKKIELDRLEIDLKQQKDRIPLSESEHSIKRHPLDVYGTAVFEDDNIIAFINSDNHQALWRHGTRTLQFNKIVKPLENRNFYLLFYTRYNRAGFFNKDTRQYKQLPGRMSGLEDLDRDGLPEVIMIRDRELYAYKIVNTDKNPTMKLWMKNPQPKLGNASWDENYIVQNGRDYLIKPRFAYSKNDDIVVIEAMQTLDGSRTAISREFDNYFQKWSTTDRLSFRQTIHKIDFPDSMARNHVYLNLSPVDRIKVLKLAEKRKEYTDCYSFGGYEFEKLYSEMFPDGLFEDPKLLLCTDGDGYTKFRDGTLAVMDFDSYESEYLLISRGDVLDGEAAFLSSNSRYLVVYDLYSNDAKLYLWEKLLGYRPHYIKYFDGKKLVVIDNDNALVVYDVGFHYSSVKKESW